jgi:hypothetical protein
MFDGALPQARCLAQQILIAALALLAIALLAPAVSRAAILTVGSPLSVPATLNTSDHLSYQGTNTMVPPNPEYPTGVVHTFHFGADTALWNTSIAGADAAMPVDGQAVRINLEGCATAAPGGPAPLTQIHFQSLSPVRGGGARVSLSSQPFDLPVCGRGGASGSTVTSYEPINLCVHRGDYVALNDEGGWLQHYYQSGVPYQVIGSVHGSALDSFIRGNGTGNGALLSALDVTPMDGFAANANEELMLQVILGTGPDARYVCPGGTKDAAPVLAPFRVSRQTDGVNHSRIVHVAVYCRPAQGCNGKATLSVHGAGASAVKKVGATSFHVPGNKTSHVAIRISRLLMRRVRRRHGVATRFEAVVSGQTFSQTVTVKIY